MSITSVSVRKFRNKYFYFYDVNLRYCHTVALHNDVHDANISDLNKCYFLVVAL
jgi:hypothetical protein